MADHPGYRDGQRPVGSTLMHRGVFIVLLLAGLPKDTQSLPVFNMSEHGLQRQEAVEPHSKPFAFADDRVGVEV